jgi:hypothetical protein
MTDKEFEVKLRTIEGELCVVVGGLAVGKRHAGQWVAIEPGWRILELEDGDRLEVSYHGAEIH